MVLQTKMPADNERFAERGALPTRKILCGKEVCRPHESLLEAAPASSRHPVVRKRTRHALLKTTC